MAKKTEEREAVIEQKKYPKPVYEDRDIYAFDAENFEYIHKIEFTGNVLPAFHALEAPPSVQEKEAAIWNVKKGRWEIVPDHRGEIVYDINGGAPCKMSVVGEVPATHTLEAPPENGYFDFIKDEWKENKAAAELHVRTKRNGLLFESDVEVTKKLENAADVSALREYRQALRDIPKQKGFPLTVKWPVKPE